ncbi:MAG: ATP-binding cassette domain-containing protein [Oscillospiraceae bacterium]|nr:ATP-binding cassette domain-containing protein [Oscillospiraceae bacterium]
MNKIIEVSSLYKKFNNVTAVNGIDFSVNEGSLFAFLGENGAGKSTTIEILCTLLKSDGGEVIVDGYKLGREDDKIRNSIGIVFQDNLLDPLLTVRENLLYRGGLYKSKGKKLKTLVDNALEITSAKEFSKRAYGKLSGGERRRVDIARALMNTPKILFLDEPTTGLDPSIRKDIWDMINKLKKENNMTIFLTTHYMEEANIADFIVVMNHGKIIERGSPIDLKERYSMDLLKVKPKFREDVLYILNENNMDFFEDGEVFVVKLNSTLESIDKLKLFKDKISNLEVLNGTMDDVFINISRSVKQ